MDYDYRKSKAPGPMVNPCRYCPKEGRCKSAVNYKCDLFRVVFIQSWNDTTSFLKEKLGVKKEKDNENYQSKG